MSMFIMAHIRVTKRLLWSAAVLFSLVNCEFTLTVLHTNDVHSRFEQYKDVLEPCTSEQARQGECYGGVARRAMAIKKLRVTEPNVILVDAGDQFQGTLWFLIHKGLATAHFMNLFKYDAMSLGSHEFDRDIPGLVPFLRNVTFPVVSSNLDISLEPSLQGLIQKSTILTVGGERVGVVGYTATQTKDISNPGKVIFNDEIESVRAEVNRLRSNGINKILGLGHAGIELDRQIAASVEGIDVVIGGRSDTFLYTGKAPDTDEIGGPYPIVVEQEGNNTCLVVNAFGFGKYLGHLRVRFSDDGKAEAWGGNPVLLNASIAEDVDTQRELEALRVAMTEIQERVIGETVVRLEGTAEVCRLEECNMGNLIADATVYYQLGKANDEYWVNTSIAIVGSGSIRASFSPGPITTAAIKTVQPYGSLIDMVEIPGSTILEILEHSVRDYDPTKLVGKFLQFSGIKVVYDLSKPNGERVVTAEALCDQCTIPRFEPLDPEKNYKVLMTSFLIRGGDKYDMIPGNIVQRKSLGQMDQDILEAYVSKLSPIITGLDGRIKFVEPEEQTTAAPMCTTVAIESGSGKQTITWVIKITPFLIMVSTLEIINLHLN